MKKIEAKTENHYLYKGAFDSPDGNKRVSFYTDEKVEFNIQDAVGSFKNIDARLSINDLKQMCKDSNIKATVYPSGYVGFSKLDSSIDELKTCYISEISTIKTNYIVCVAFDETQPMLYKAELVSVFLVDVEI